MSNSRLLYYIFDVVYAKFDTIDAKFDVADAKFDVADVKFEVISTLSGFKTLTELEKEKLVND